MSLTLVAVLMCGQYRQCTTATVYQQQHYSQGYIQKPTYFVDAVSFVATDPYYSKLVGSQARQQASAQADATLAQQVGLLTSELARLRQQLSGLAPAIPPPPIVPPPPTPIVPPPPTPISDLEKVATSVITKKCSSCHTDPAKSGNGYKLLGADGTLATLSPFQKLTLDQKCYSGEMPPDPKQALTAEEYSTIRAWINEDKDAIETALKGSTK